ncbi:MAG: formylglycine-generating enzyme family protein [Bacteroidaceae bacterium]|nr:formylglycine-generating enzyme family protein [Bacteroidaceae bacterium]
MNQDVMRRFTIQSLLVAFLLLFALPLSAQKLTVESMRLLPDDATARDEKYQRVDDNGNLAGLVKVQIALNDVKLDGSMVLDQKKWSASEYWVWMADRATKLTVVTPGFLPLEVNFRDYDFQMLHSKNTYKLVISVPTAASQYQSNIQTFTVNGASFNMVRVEGGTFQMGGTSEQGDDAHNWEKPVHSVTLSTYMIGETEVTQEVWEAVMGSNPSTFKGAKNPVEQVSWDDCKVFINKLNDLTGQSFRLPTEAEWEYAARGGNKRQHYKFSGSNNIGDVAWYDGNSSGNTHPVSTKKANKLGLYDMSGNVYEWCEDGYNDYNGSAQLDPKGESSSSFRVYRGGGWFNNAGHCRVSYRSSYTPEYRDDGLGFRLAL